MQSFYSTLATPPRVANNLQPKEDNLCCYASGTVEEAASSLSPSKATAESCFAKSLAPGPAERAETYPDQISPAKVFSSASFYGNQEQWLGPHSISEAADTDQDEGATIGRIADISKTDGSRPKQSLYSFPKDDSPQSIQPSQPSQSSKASPVGQLHPNDTGEIAHSTTSNHVGHEQQRPAALHVQQNRDLRALGFEEWLHEIDPEGRLTHYLAIVEDCFDTVAQIVKSYVVSMNGSKVLDHRVFEDLGIQTLADKLLFERWFANVCGTCRLLQQAVQNRSKVLNGHGSPATAASLPQQAPPNAQGIGKGMPASHLRNLSFDDWLLQVDPSGSLLCYRQRVIDQFDTVTQIIKSYTLLGKGGPVLDPQFFDDVLVANDGHRGAFLRWFAEEAGLGGATASDAVSGLLQPTASTPASSNLAEHAGSFKSGDGYLRSLNFRDWLLSIDPRGQLLRYQGTLEDSYDTLSQVVDTYVTVADGHKQLDLRFFADVGAMFPEHRQLFRHWFDVHCGTTQTMP